MSWNYRVIRHVDANRERSVWYRIHEVYYDDKDEPYLVSIASIDPHGESPEELERDLDLMLKAVDQPIIDYSFFEKGRDK